MKLHLIISLILASTVVIQAETNINGIVTRVIDGNTIEVTEGTDTYKVLLHGVDSPDPGQHYAEQAKKMLEKLLLQKAVTIVMHGKDRLGNRIGEIRIDGAPDPRKQLVAEGLAWTSEKEPVEELESIKEQARLQGKGLWGEENPTPPWVYRRQQTMMVEKSS
ncbi:MAG TPA: thermonuclease family protein [Cyclobacteriaceae bacterium]|nr:thermonuclease family protein [Cyclobacteriaceae bacterium]